MAELLKALDHYESAKEQQTQSTISTIIHIGMNINRLPLTFIKSGLHLSTRSEKFTTVGRTTAVLCAFFILVQGIIDFRYHPGFLSHRAHVATVQPAPGQPDQHHRTLPSAYALRPLNAPTSTG